MKRHIAAIATAAIAAGGVALAVAPGVNASAQAPIRTYHYSENFNLTGLGQDAGWYDRFSSKQTANLSGRLAMSEGEQAKYFNSHDKLVSNDSMAYIVNGRFYSKNDGASIWTSTKLTAAQQRVVAQDLDPYYSAALIYALPGIRPVGAGHYQVTGTPAQMSPFLTHEYGLTANDLTSGGIKAVTVNLFVGPAGRPLEFTVSAHSSLENVTIAEKFSDYNKPVTIKAP